MSCLILHGRRRFLHLQKCRYHLSVPLQNTFWFSSAVRSSLEDGRKEKTFTVSYLVESLGFAPKLAESISKRISFNDNSNPDSVLNLLTRYGFTDSQISTIVTAYPQLLTQDPEKSIAPKLQFLLSRGASNSELTEIVTKVPKLLGLKNDKPISLYYDFIKDMTSSKFVKLDTSLSQGSGQENKMRNISVLRELGVPQRLLFPLLISDRGFCFGKERFGESLKKVVEMGFDPTTTKFVKALQIVQALSEKTIEDKVRVYKRLGFSVDDVWVMFKKFPFLLAYSEKKILNSFETFLDLGFTRDDLTMMVKCLPPCLNLSAESVKKKSEFLVTQMNWSLKDVVMVPQALAFSMEKRIGPRCKIIKALGSRGLLGSEYPLISSVLKSSDEEFLKRYVRNHDDKQLVLELMAMFTNHHVS